MAGALADGDRVVLVARLPGQALPPDAMVRTVARVQGGRWLDAVAADRVAREARQRFRVRRQAGRVHGGRAWQAGGNDPAQRRFTTPYSRAEYRLDRLPPRFGRGLEGLLDVDERLLYAIERPPESLRGGRLGLPRRAAERRAGLLLLTDRQLIWMVDHMPPDRYLLDWGVDARLVALEALREVRLTGDETLELHVQTRGGGAVFALPGELRAEAEVLRDLAARFLPVEGMASLLRRYAPAAVEFDPAPAALFRQGPGSPRGRGAAGRAGTRGRAGGLLHPRREGHPEALVAGVTPSRIGVLRRGELRGVDLAFLRDISITLSPLVGRVSSASPHRRPRHGPRRSRTRPRCRRGPPRSCGCSAAPGPTGPPPGRSRPMPPRTRIGGWPEGVSRGTPGCSASRRTPDRAEQAGAIGGCLRAAVRPAEGPRVGTQAARQLVDQLPLVPQVHTVPPAKVLGEVQTAACRGGGPAHSPQTHASQCSLVWCASRRSGSRLRPRSTMFAAVTTTCSWLERPGSQIGHGSAARRAAAIRGRSKSRRGARAILDRSITKSYTTAGRNIHPSSRDDSTARNPSAWRRHIPQDSQSRTCVSGSSMGPAPNQQKYWISLSPSGCARSAGKRAMASGWKRRTAQAVSCGAVSSISAILATSPRRVLPVHRRRASARPRRVHREHASGKQNGSRSPTRSHHPRRREPGASFIARSIGRDRTASARLPGKARRPGGHGVGMAPGDRRSRTGSEARGRAARGAPEATTDDQAVRSA